MWEDKHLADRMIVEYPLIMTLSVDENIAPTFKYLVGLGYEKEEIRGRYLGSSLYQRLVVRWEFWQFCKKGGMGTMDGKEVLDCLVADMGCNGDENEDKDEARRQRISNRDRPAVHVLTTASSSAYSEYCCGSEEAMEEWKDGEGKDQIGNAVWSIKFGIWVGTGKGGGGL